MVRVLFLVSILAAFVFAQDECSVYNPCKTVPAESSAYDSDDTDVSATPNYTSGPKNSGFYFDMTLAGSRRHLEATKVTTRSNYEASGCHFEMDGRYICNEEERKPTREENTLGYSGYGSLLGVRFGGAFKGMFALFANIELEITQGKTTGRRPDEDVKPRSIFIGAGPGVTIYPLSHSNGAAQNVYTSVAADILLGGGGGIGLFGGNVMLEVGYLWPVSDRINVGVALGGDILSTDGLDTDKKDEGGYSIWLGFKVVRK